jgi:serine/threonine-protein phosphatase 4 regulatory subunit 1
MWPKLKPTYDLLVNDSRWKVRRTLSFSLHEIAKIIGPDFTEKDLIPVLFHFLNDIPEVREGVV